MRVIRKNLKWVTVILVIVILIIVCGVKYFLMRDRQVDTFQEEESSFPLEKQEDNNELEEQQPIEVFYVDIKGAVNQPGVYEIEKGKKVIDVVQLAGGFTEQADSSFVNLAKKVEDEMVIIIYTLEEVKKATQENSIAKIIDKECICPEVKNDACLQQNNSQTSKDQSKKQEKINLNTATLEELQTLSGIGESKAKAIIEYRETVGLFNTIEDLKKVSGIGDSLYEKVKNDITV